MLKIVIYQRGAVCDGNSVYTKPLGGTESAMIYMAHALHQRGHQVHVFCDVDKAGVYDGVEYHSSQDFEKFASTNSFDVFMAIRNMVPVLIKRWAPVQVYFSPDAYDQPFVNKAFSLQAQSGTQAFEIGLYSLAQTEKYVDAVFCVGHWQAETFKQRFKIPADKVHVVSNGVSRELIESVKNPENRKIQMAYNSTPFRGLEYLLKYFPDIKKQVPQASLVVMSGMQLYGHNDQQDHEQYKDLYALADQDGVELLGPQLKNKMIEVLKQSRVLSYPNTFAETFCIAALEAQACGLPVVSTRLAAMEERVTHEQDGYLVSGDPSQSDYQSQFVDHCVKLLTDDQLWQQMSVRSFEKAMRFDYHLLASQWEQLFESYCKNSPSNSNHSLQIEDQHFNITANGQNQSIHLEKNILAKEIAKIVDLHGFPITASQLATIGV